MNQSIEIPRLGKIDGVWHKLVINRLGYQQWVKCGELHRDIAHKTEDNGDLGIVRNAESAAVNEVLHAIDGILPNDFITDLRRKAEAKMGHRLGEGGMLKANGDVVKVSVHIFLENSFISRMSASDIQANPDEETAP